MHNTETQKLTDKLIQPLTKPVKDCALLPSISHLSPTREFNNWWLSYFHHTLLCYLSNKQLRFRRPWSLSGIARSPSCYNAAPCPSIRSLQTPSSHPATSTSLLPGCLCFAISDAALAKAVFSQAGAPNSWFRESQKMYWRPDLLSWDKTHRGGLAPQDGDASMETIT